MLLVLEEFDARRPGEKKVDVAEVNQLRWLGESGKWLENGDRTHVVLGSGRPELQKRTQMMLTRQTDTLLRP